MSLWRTVKRALGLWREPEHLRRLGNPETKFRFDIVEVLLLDGAVSEVRHLPNAFPLTKPKRER